MEGERGGRVRGVFVVFKVMRNVVVVMGVTIVNILRGG
jgi:hypothetical protein